MPFIPPLAHCQAASTVRGSTSVPQLHGHTGVRPPSALAWTLAGSSSLSPLPSSQSLSTQQPENFLNCKPTSHHSLFKKSEDFLEKDLSSSNPDSYRRRHQPFALFTPSAWNDLPHLCLADSFWPFWTQLQCHLLGEVLSAHLA